MISYFNVSINYANEVVFQDFSLEINKGEKVVLSGPSGSGKSTLLHAIMGFVKPASGEIKVAGKILNPQNSRFIRKQISWLPQELSFDIKDCRDLAYFPFTYKYNQPLFPTQKEMDEMLESLLLPADILQKRTDEISGGQKQRIMLASMLLLKRPIVLLDEPTSALDADAVRALVEYIKHLPDVTLVSTSHDDNWVKNMDKIIDIKKK